VDLVAEDGSGLLILHDGSQQWFADDDGVRVVLSAYDPWDEDRFNLSGICGFRLIPHQGLSNADRWRLSQEFTRPPILIKGKGDQPVEPFSLVACDAPGVAITAVYRETEAVTPPGGKLAYPTFIRLVELNGQEAHANLTFGATLANAWRTNLLGEPTNDPCDFDSRQVRTTLRPFEIATVCVDLVEARKQVRDLDAKREIWATVHRQD
jgi:alpha-mannosidase